MSFFFSFPILGEENGFFFFATFFAVTDMKKWEGMLFVHCRPLLAQPSRNSLPSLAFPLHILIFISAWFFWESFVCGRVMPDDMERGLCSWGAMAPCGPAWVPPVLHPSEDENNTPGV